MEYGKYFKLSSNSDLENGIASYYYLPVSMTLNDSSIPKYPIYLVITKFAINFYYHRRYDDSTDSCNQDKIIHHQNTRILHLPLSPNLAVKDDLSYILRNSFSDYLDVDQEFELENRNSYNYFYGENKYIQENRLLKRQLILDFIFDWEHTKLFEHCSNYEEIEVRIKENNFFNAICAKAGYYYYREKYVKSKLKHDRHIFSEDLAEAERQWLNILQSSDAVDICWNSGGWFDSSEKEYNRVLFSKGTFNRLRWRRSLNRKSTDYKTNDLRILRSSAQWYIRRYAICNAFKAINLHSNSWKIYRTIFYIALIFLAFKIFKYSEDLNYSLNDSIFTFFITGLFYTAILYLIYTLLNRNYFLPKIGLIMPRLIMAITSAWIIFITTDELWTISFDLFLFEQLWILLLIIPIIVFVMIEINNLAPDIALGRILLRSVSIVIAGLCISLLVGSILTSVTQYKMLSTNEEFSKFCYSVKNEKNDRFYIGDENKDDYNDLLADSTIKESEFIELGRIKTKRINTDGKDRYGLIQTKKDFIFRIEHSLLLQIKLPFLGTILIFPGLVFFRAIFAVFIGIFIQLIFEEKPITEPL